MNILIIEDDLDFRTILTRSLEREGHRVFFVSEMDELDDLGFEITHIIVDLRLKTLSGLDFIPLLRTKFKDSYILMLTAFGSVATSVEAIKLGADNYLLKPCSFSEIYDALCAPKENLENTFKYMSLYQKEKEYIEFVLNRFDGNISQASKALGIHRQSLQRKLKKYSIKE